MTRIRYVFVALLLLMTFIVQAEDASRHFPKGVHDVEIPEVHGVRTSLLQNIAPIVEHSIKTGLYPGAVILASHHGHIIYRGVFGSRRIVPDKAPMTFNTIFDIASLTKVLVTTTAIMQLVEKGKIDLDSPVGNYWPAFNHHGKDIITVRQLLTHTSGLPAEVNFVKSNQPTTDSKQDSLPADGKTRALKGVEQQALVNTPGTVFKYSDVNFVALGRLVEIISGEQLDEYAEAHIFQPLGLRHTFYSPSEELKNEIAPTQIVDGKLRWGTVHDDTVYLMGGVAGMAGVFSTAADLGTFAQCLLNGGRIHSHNHQKKARYLLGPLTIYKMTSPQTPRQMTDIHGLGWDIDTRYSNRGVLFPIKSFGHTGFTGTSLWIDPTTQTWLVILTSRTHPTPATVNPLIYDRKAIANIIAGSLTDVPSKHLNNTGNGELARAFNVKKEK